MLESSDVHEYLKKHAHAMVERALAEYPTLSECVAVLSLADGAPPRLVARKTAAETLKGEYPSFLFELDLLSVTDIDDLGVVGWLDGVPFADTLTVSHGLKDGKKTAPMKVPPFKRGPATKERLDEMAGTIAGLQKAVYEGVPEPYAFFIFWELFNASPILLVRERAKATLGNHRKWKKMLPHIYTPCDDLLVLADPGGDRELVPFVRTNFLEQLRKTAN